MYILGWGFPRIHEFRWDQERFADSQSEVALHEFEGHPRAFILSEVGVGVGNAVSRSFGGFLKFGILLDDLSELIAHHVKLAVIYAESEYSDYGKNYIRSYDPFFCGSEFSREFMGFILCVIGLRFSVTEQCGFQRSWWNH